MRDRVFVGKNCGTHILCGIPFIPRFRVVKNNPDKNAGENATLLLLNPTGLWRYSDITRPRLKQRTLLPPQVAQGLGGAGFPTHVKLNIDKDKVDTLIINAAE